MKRIRSAFTLIELLTVIAISSILLGLIIVPLFQSFNLTRSAQAFSDAQDRARILTDQIAREIGNAQSVRGGDGNSQTSVNGTLTQVPLNSLVVRLPSQTRTTTVDAVLPFSKIDIIRPAEGDQSQVLTNSYKNPSNGYIDPTLHEPKGQVLLPVAPGFTLVRYFVGRRDPFSEYNNPYDGILMARGSGRDNLCVLYRAVVQPLTPKNGSFVPNPSFFEADKASGTQFVHTLHDGTTTEYPGMDDPRFFEPTRDVNGKIVDDSQTPGSQGSRIRNWIKASTVVTEVSRYDMVSPVYDIRSHVAQYDTNGVPRVVPLVQFRPERLSNDPAVAQVAVRQGQESDAAQQYESDVFLTQFGLWSEPVIRTYPQGWDPSNNLLAQYQVGLTLPRAGSAGIAPGFATYAFDAQASAQDTDAAHLTELFDNQTYQRYFALKGTTGSSPDKIYPFSVAVKNSNNRSNWLGTARWREIFTPFRMDAERGKVISSFGIDEVGDPTSTPTDPDNLPVVQTGLGDAYSPFNDANPLTGNFYDPAFSSINERFNKIWHDYSYATDVNGNKTDVLGNNIHRFIDLRVVPNSDGTPSPLYPDPISGAACGFTYDTPDGGKHSKVQIVPGSEVVVGPDQIAGSHQGMPIRYTRVASGEPGPNQYKINYTDLQEPNEVGVINYALAYPKLSIGNFDPRTYDPKNFISSVIQPRYKVGYVQFNSDPASPLPFASSGTVGQQSVRISYNFQFTGTRTGIAASVGRAHSDAFAVDYDTRQLMSVQLTIRNYPQSTIPNPQSVTLKSTATVRNYTR